MHTNWSAKNGGSQFQHVVKQVTDHSILGSSVFPLPPAVRIPALMSSTLRLLITEKPKVVGTCLGTPKHPHDLTTTQQDGSKALQRPRKVPVTMFSLCVTKIPCEIGSKTIKSMEFHQISNFLLTEPEHYYSFLCKT